MAARIVVTEFVSLDGVMEAPGGEPGFKYPGWTFEFDRGEDGNQFKLNQLPGIRSVAPSRSSLLACQRVLAPTCSGIGSSMAASLRRSCASTRSRRSASASDPRSPSGLDPGYTMKSCRPSRGDVPLTRPSNNAGGLEGGVTNGEDVRVTGFMKPIATLMKPLRSVDLSTLQNAEAAIERSDVCAVPAAAVVGEAMVSFVLADAFLEKFGGDSIEEIARHVAATREAVERRFAAR